MAGRLARMGTLYVVSTPIGNLEDISLRALRILREVSLIAAEDTRHTRKLLNHFEIPTRTISYHQHSAPARTAQLLDALAAGDVAMVTDAGTPGLSDPGGELVEAAVEAGFPVVAVPGASALLTLVAASGLPAARFAYLGFLPRKGKERTAILERAAAAGWPFVIYEAPQRLASTLEDIRNIAGDRPLAVGRELTKLHEEIYRGRISDALAHFSLRDVRGEIVIMVGAPTGDEMVNTQGADERAAGLDGLLLALRAQGLTAKDAARQAAQATGTANRDAYRRLIELESDTRENNQEDI